MSTIFERRDQLVAKLSRFEGKPQERYMFLIEMGKALPPWPAHIPKTDQDLVPGCLSQVWLKGSCQDGSMVFWADSDAFLPKGMVALLLKIYQGATRQEVLSLKLEDLDGLGLKDQLSWNRRNSTAYFLGRIQDLASLTKA